MTVGSIDTSSVDKASNRNEYFFKQFDCNNEAVPFGLNGLCIGY